MPRDSAGLLVYRRGAGRPLEVLLVHPGGPFWALRDDGAWSVPKGEVDGEEALLAAAEREVAEELGHPVPPGPRVALGEVVQAGGKHVSVWAVEADVDVTDVTSNTFEMEWPPHSGSRRRFPEVDRAAWFSVDTARAKLLAAQVPLLDRLVAALH